MCAYGADDNYLLRNGARNFNYLLRCDTAVLERVLLRHVRHLREDVPALEQEDRERGRETIEGRLLLVCHATLLGAVAKDALSGRSPYRSKR